ncbi:MAG: Dabb family protein [Acidobacteriota bacterium]|jgi:antibiotic biosynthesis monooxygenase (ABM) superfamily enzyme
MLNPMRKLMATTVLAATLLAGGAVAAERPKTVIHVINVKFKADAAKADIDKAIAAIDTVAGKYKGIKRVWLNPITVQGGASKFTHCLVMEFESVEALKKYTDSPEQKEWYKLWIPVRELSNTHDVTN